MTTKRWCSHASATLVKTGAPSDGAPVFTRVVLAGTCMGQQHLPPPKVPPVSQVGGECLNPKPPKP